jgi:membrane associated rhomboid family serine protease
VDITLPSRRVRALFKYSRHSLIITTCAYSLVHLLLTLVVQLCIMRDVERLTGPLRMAVIYLGSGMGGNLASAIFVPYRAEVQFNPNFLCLS